MAWFDGSYINAARGVQFPNYADDFYKAYQISSEMPWSARKQRERAIEDYGLMMQQQKFQADMAQQNRQMQIQEMMLPYQLQRAQRLASGNPYGTGDQPQGSALDVIMQLPRPGQAPVAPIAPVMPVTEIPVDMGIPGPIDGELPMDPGYAPTDLGLIPDPPAY